MQVLTDEPINIEAPEYQSKEHTLYVYTALPSDKQPSGYPLIISVTLPVHVRYHKPATDLEVTHVPIIMYPPRVLFNCSNTRTGELEFYVCKYYLRGKIEIWSEKLLMDE